MRSIFIQLFQVFADVMVELFTGIFIEPGKAIYYITMEYLVQTDLDPIAFVGLFVSLYCIFRAVKAACILVKAVVRHLMRNYHAKKRAEIAALKKRIRKRAEENIAYQREFDELYEKYVLNN